MFSYAGGHAAGLALLARRDRPDAIFCANDLIALGVLDAARYGHRLKVPRDVSIMGFDDVPMAAWAGNALTTVRLPVEEMVERAVELLGRAMAERQEKAEVVRIAGELFVRSTTRAVPGGSGRAPALFAVGPRRANS